MFDRDHDSTAPDLVFPNLLTSPGTARSSPHRPPPSLASGESTALADFPHRRGAPTASETISLALFVSLTKTILARRARDTLSLAFLRFSQEDAGQSVKAHDPTSHPIHARKPRNPGDAIWWRPTPSSVRAKRGPARRAVASSRGGRGRLPRDRIPTARRLAGRRSTRPAGRLSRPTWNTTETESTEGCDPALAPAESRAGPANRDPVDAATADSRHADSQRKAAVARATPCLDEVVRHVPDVRPTERTPIARVEPTRLCHGLCFEFVHPDVPPTV
jgi:hypothetical protein